MIQTTDNLKPTILMTDEIFTDKCKHMLTPAKGITESHRTPQIGDFWMNDYGAILLVTAVRDGDVKDYVAVRSVAYANGDGRGLNDWNAMRYIDRDLVAKSLDSLDFE